MNISLFIVAIMIGSVLSRPENVKGSSEQLGQHQGIDDDEIWKKSVQNFWQDLKEESDSKLKKYIGKLKEFLKDAKDFANVLEMRLKRAIADPTSLNAPKIDVQNFGQQLKEDRKDLTLNESSNGINRNIFKDADNFANDVEAQAKDVSDALSKFEENGLKIDSTK